MGCCQSSTDRSPYDSPAPTSAALPSNGSRGAPLPRDSSRAAINQPHRSLSNVDSNHGSSLSPSQKARPNQPIRPPTPLARSPEHVSKDPPPWTRRQLEREREAFFDTRVSGNDEVWKALRVVCEMLRRGEVAEAQGILDAMNMTCPNGRVAKGRGRERQKGGLYDEQGNLYDLPAWVVTDPEDIAEDDDKEVTEDKEEDVSENEDGEEISMVSPKPKGKGRAEDPGEIVQVRARLSDRGTDVVVSAGMKQKVAVLVRSLQEQIGNKRVRLMYLGKALDERTTLEDSAWISGHVINALVFEGDESMLSKKALK